MYNYDDGFDDWRDIQRQFDMEVPEPEEVLYAQYDIEGYEGSAIVIYRIGDRFYINFGGHCSCYGLEGQWDSEEYSAELFLQAYSMGSWYDRIPSEVFGRVKEFLENKYNGA
jgi:hypothetical protein